MVRFNRGDRVRIVHSDGESSGRVLARYDHVARIEPLDEYLIELPSARAVRLSRFQLEPGPVVGPESDSRLRSTIP